MPISKPETLPISPELTTALRPYLPAFLERQCLVGGELRAPELCAQHLSALLRTITTYLPRQVVLPLLAAPELGKVEGHFTYGTVMFSDISGFTAMSEKLSQLGKEGAEEITAIVNRFFAALLAVTGSYGGDLLKFGGDALLVFFGGPEHARRACQAALQMQATMARFSETPTSQGVFRLQMTIGLGTGPLFMAHLGSTEGMEFAVMGRAMAQMAQAEDLAAAGEIFVDATTWQAVAGQATAAKTSDGFYQLVSLAAEDIPAAPAEDLLTTLLVPATDETLLDWITATVRRIHALELFLPPGLLDKIKLEPERVVIGGEYRPVTVLFANFYGIDEIIEQLGETRTAEITAVLNAHFTTMRQIIAKYGGVVNKVDSYAVGHRIMALFGAPRAHIDDPERAVRAALEMQEAMAAFARLDTSCGTYCLQQRIGVNTGLVFAGNVGAPTRQEYSVMGDEVNLTARLMAVATDGQVLTSQSTARQSGGAFLLHVGEPVRVKGKARPVPNYEVLGLQTHRARERRPLIGRDAEWEQIHHLTDLGLAGQPQVLTLVGDVGLGKSRLLDEVAAHWNEHGALSLSTTCPSFGRHTPYLPWLELLRDLFGLNQADSDQVKQEKITALLRETDPTWGDWTTLITSLLGLAVEETELVHALDAQTRQRTLFRVIIRLIEHVASERPLLLTIDDLQWADDTSVELVNQVARQVTRCPFLLAVAYRPEDQLPLNVADLPYHTGLRLQELSDEASLRLLDTLLPTTPQMPEHIKQLILDKAHGNPLFIEEVAHTLIENYLTLDETTGTYHARTDLEMIEIPDSVNRVIMSRIDRLDESSRNVLRVASVIGREFAQWLLNAIYPYRQVEGELRERLSDLTARELLEGPYTEYLYLFRHILTREVAYESLLFADRRQLHRRIGESVETQQAGHLAEYWEILAHHFSLAEEWDKALTYHLQAGHKAQSIYANETAAHHFKEALKAARRVPSSQDRQLLAHESLGEVLTTTGDYENALANYHRALTLVMLLDTPIEERHSHLTEICRKIASIYEQKSDYTTAFEWLQGGLSAIEGRAVPEAARIYLMGAGLYHRQGEHAAALEWCQKSLAIAGQETGRDQLSITAHAYYLLGLIYSRLGDTARTIEFCQQSLAIYEQIEEINGAALAHINLGNGYFDLGDWAAATDHYRQALEIKRKIGDAYYQAVITLNLGGVYRNQGNLDLATHYNEQSLHMWQELGSTYAIALLHNNMGAVALQQGAPERALALLQQSLDLFQQINSTDFLPEVHRHFAEVYLDQGNLPQALEEAQLSLSLARTQEMRLEEGATLRVLGQVYLAAGELTAAQAALQESLATLEALHSRYEVGQTLFQLAQLHRVLGRQADSTAALEQATAIFQELGARLDLEQAQRWAAAEMKTGS